MSAESQRLRDGIRSGAIGCRCMRAEGQCGDYHVAGCPWINAVLEIYRLERAEEHCLTCKRVLNDPAEPDSLDCGGDCRGCMRDIFLDPDCE